MSYGGPNREHRRGVTTRALACEDCTPAKGLPAVRGTTLVIETPMNPFLGPRNIH